jgi:high-affinity Fe2+/Pb2+ permease
MLGLEAVVLFLTIPVMLTLTDVSTGAGVAVGAGLTVACLLAAGLMRRPIGGWIGWLVQLCAIGLGFVVPVMFVLGVVFLALYAGSWVLGARIDQERAEREQQVRP